MTKHKLFLFVLDFIFECICYVGAAFGAYHSDIAYVIFFLGFLIANRIKNLTIIEHIRRV